MRLLPLLVLAVTAVTALAAAVSFDFFLTAPYLSLAIKHPSNVLATVLLLVVGLAVGGIARGRTEARSHAQSAHEEIAALHRVTRDAAADSLSGGRRRAIFFAAHPARRKHSFKYPLRKIEVVRTFRPHDMPYDEALSTLPHEAGNIVWLEGDL